MIRRWIYGASTLLVLLNATCQSGEKTDTQQNDSTQVAASDDHSGHNHGPDGAGGTTYTCPMHPQIVQSSAGTCPICSMDLVPVVKTGEKATEIMLSESQMQLANVMVQPVASGNIGNSTVLNARLAADQQQTDVISSRVAGRIERLYVKETGQPIRKGQVLYEIYSEPLLTQQQEYLLALRQVEELKEPRYEDFRRASEQKLKLYGMTAEQIARLAKTRNVQPRIPFVAPAGGTVTEIAASEGQYVGEGALLYRLANLSQLWVEAELYAGEARFVKVGDRVPVQVVGYETSSTMNARVTFINPEYRAGSQVLVMRAVLPNPGGRFQPGQQARVLLRHGVQRGLTLPVDAVVRAGQGAVVFVQTGRQSEGRTPDGAVFQPRRVQTGTETDQQVAITGGLNGDEQVAMSGAYLLYSELILKKGINPITAEVEEGVKSTPTTESNPTAPAVRPRADAATVPKSHKVPEAFKKQLTAVYVSSLKLTESLVGSNSGQSKAAAVGVEKVLSGVDMMLLKGAAHTDWMTYLNAMNAGLKTLRGTGDLEKQRTAYAQFEDGLYRSVKAFGVNGKPVYRQYCPMALNNKGSYWLSDKKPIRNPYFGDQMLTCGETKEEIN
ncbi:efflux RND transporter periplasmic adaptor subunit [Spirosoma sordidisoli]|uniref:Efflux RND transporter periplasmic adaptor subunit n=1 Tax=Spirosoma sordidisoli TaxID=2502893 RepID=A0A4Q2UCH9_9BACT|nr:efflux RND transporter periplasmic adaptor subunit [Spirosoma sordidisoli]RYC66476.1 efflux RND transporter periplasmic adaptor subunit [Spirosoma sordidisoli]